MSTPPDPLPAEETSLDRRAWIEAALAVLVRDGIEAVKIASLAEQLGITRGSFYWHFRNRADLTDALLAVWAQRNTAAVVSAADAPADTLQAAIMGIFEVWVSPEGFDHRLDFSVRAWGRSDGRVGTAVRAADEARVAALTRMFARHGVAAKEAFIRARVLYFTQIGYYALEVEETEAQRRSLAPLYLRVLAGET